MQSVITCGNCGEIITRDYQPSDPTQREPCPKCGSTVRKYDEYGEPISFSMAASGDAVLIRYARHLLKDAKRHAEDAEYQVSVIVAHVACEVAVERTLAKALEDQGIDRLEDALFHLLPSFNLGNSSVREIYTAITADQIQREHFWDEFTKSAARRNKVIHRGASVTEQEAQSSLKATEAFVTHLGM